MRKSIVIVFNNDGMGQAPEELRHKLASIFLRLLDESDTLPAKMCFYSEGVKLVVEGSPIIRELRALEAKGVELIVCNTCLNYFALIDKVKVGIVGGMPDIISAMWGANSVITL